MSDIFISYAREDKARVEILAKALQANGWSVWWDPHIPIGKRFDQVIEEALTEARCIIVVWSNHSISSPYVRAEANEGIDRQVLLPVMIEEVKIPLVFRQIQTARLVDWHGSPYDPEFEKLVKDIEATLGMWATPKLAADSSVASPTSTAKLRGLISKYPGTIRPKNLSYVSYFLKILGGVVSVALLIGIVVWMYNSLSNQESPTTNVNLATPTPQSSPTAPPQNDVVVRNLSDLGKHIKVIRVAFYQGECSDTRPAESQLKNGIDPAILSQTRWFIELEFPKASRRIDFVLRVTFYDLEGKARGAITKPNAYVEPDWVNSWHCSHAGLDRAGSLARGAYNAEVYVGESINKLSKVAAHTIDVY